MKINDQAAIKTMFAIQERENLFLRQGCSPKTARERAVAFVFKKPEFSAVLIQTFDLEMDHEHSFSA